MQDPRNPTLGTKGIFFLWQMWCKWGVKSSWYAWVCHAGHSPLGSSPPIVSGGDGQECVSNVHMNKCGVVSVTFPHVRQDAVSHCIQLDPPNGLFEPRHLHMSCRASWSCMFYRSGGDVHVLVILKHFLFLHGRDGGAVISQGKASDQLVLRGKSKENTSTYAVISENDW